MKRQKLVAYLREYECLHIREGGGHSIFLNPVTRVKTTVPRHSEIDDLLAEKICKQLGLPKITRGK